MKAARVYCNAKRCDPCAGRRGFVWIRVGKVTRRRRRPMEDCPYYSLLRYPVILMFIVIRWKMADENSSAPQAHGFAEKLKSWLSCSWTYVCAVWFAMVLTMIYVLRSPLKLQESVAAGNVQNNKLLLMLVCRTANVTAAWLDHNAVCSRAQQLSYGSFRVI